MTTAKTGMVNGTSLGPNLLTEASALWEKKNTYQDIADFLKDKYREKFSAATIQHALDAVAAGLEPDAQKLKDANFLIYDETPYTIMGKNGWAWVAASHDVISYHLDASRSRATFEEHVYSGQSPSTDTPYTTH